MNALTSRVSLPLTVCIIGFGIAGLMLLRSPQTATPAPAPAPQEVAEPGTEPAADPGPVELAAARVDISGFAYAGQTSVAAGQAITVANADGAPHTLTSVDGAFDTGVIGGGESGSLVAPTAPGSYAFFCALHPSMTGTLTVG